MLSSDPDDSFLMWPLLINNKMVSKDLIKNTHKVSTSPQAAPPTMLWSTARGGGGWGRPGGGNWLFEGVCKERWRSWSMYICTKMKKTSLSLLYLKSPAGLSLLGKIELHHLVFHYVNYWVHQQRYWAREKTSIFYCNFNIQSTFDLTMFNLTIIFDLTILPGLPKLLFLYSSTFKFTIFLI